MDGLPLFFPRFYRFIFKKSQSKFHFQEPTSLIASLLWPVCLTFDHIHIAAVWCSGWYFYFTGPWNMRNANIVKILKRKRKNLGHFILIAQWLPQRGLVDWILFKPSGSHHQFLVTASKTDPLIPFHHPRRVFILKIKCELLKSSTVTVGLKLVNGLLGWVVHTLPVLYR